MVNNNLYTQYDDTLYFTFNGIYSKLYNTFITREDRDDFIIISEISNNIDFTTPSYANSSYLNSNNISQYTISFHIAAYDVDNNTLDHIKSWLRLGNTGTLFFDTNKFWGYDVVISNITEDDRMYMDNDNYVISYSIEFKTIGLASYTAITNPSVSYWQDKEINTSRTFLDETICNDLSIPEIDFIKQNGTIVIPHVANGGYYINFIYEIPQDTTGFRLIINGKEEAPQFQYEFEPLTRAKQISYHSNTGLIMIDNHQLFDTEIVPALDSKNMNNGILLQHSYAPIKLSKNSVGQIVQSETLKITLTDKEYYQLLLHNYSNAFISVGHLVNLEPLYGVHSYGKNLIFSNKFYPYRYSNEGCLWYYDNLQTLPYDMVTNKYEGNFQYNHNCNSRIIADNASNLQYYVGNYDTYQIQIKQSSKWVPVLFDKLTFGIEKYKQ